MSINISSLSRRSKVFRSSKKVPLQNFCYNFFYRQPEFGGWAFNLVRGQSCQDKWDLIPEGVDLLMTHGPPLGYGDLCKGGHRAGCLQLLHTIQRKIKPKYHVFGHIHEGKVMMCDFGTSFVSVM